MSQAQSLHLPKCSLFDYLFPPAGLNTGYKAPNPKRPAFIDGLNGRTVTRHEVYEQARKLGGGLRKLGMQKDDVALITGYNSLEWLNALFGSHAAGLKVSPASYGYTPGELLHQLTDSTASLVFVDPALLLNLQKTLALPGAPKLPKSRIVLLCPPSARPAEFKDYKCVQEVWAEPIEIQHVRPGEEHNGAVLCYSSGTTGKAKGVETTHYNLTSQLQALNLVIEPLEEEKDVALGVLPFAHMYLFSTGILQTLTVGVPMVVLPRFNHVTMLEAVQKYKITWGLIVPPILISLLNTDTSAYDTSSLRALMSAAAPLGPEVQQAFQDRFKVQVTQAYGLTETSPISHIMNVKEAATHPGQIGRLVPTFEARLVSVDGPTDKDVEKGELWLKGPSVMKGYWRNPTATENTFAKGRWFKTGDVAIVDKDGYYTIVDRVKELIKYKGYQGRSFEMSLYSWFTDHLLVPPAELEALLLSYDKVADTAVIGINSASQGTELPRAYVVPKAPLESLDSAQRAALSKEIADWISTRVASYKRLRGGVILIEAIPKSPSGKILRKDLRVLAQKDNTAERAKL